MKSQAISRAMIFACACLLALVTSAGADDTDRAGSYRLAQAVKSTPTISEVDDVDPGEPQIQFGDPDDLGGGDQKRGDEMPPLDPENSALGGVLKGWTSALGELLVKLLAL